LQAFPGIGGEIPARAGGDSIAVGVLPLGLDIAPDLELGQVSTVFLVSVALSVPPSTWPLRLAKASARAASGAVCSVLLVSPSAAFAAPKAKSRDSSIDLFIISPKEKFVKA
jgi:hypothetical protein